MFIDVHRKSVGSFVIEADLVGSYGEIAHSQVGRFHKRLYPALRAAHTLVSKGYRAVVVRNRNTGWQHTLNA